MLGISKYISILASSLVKSNKYVNLVPTDIPAVAKLYGQKLYSADVKIVVLNTIATNKLLYAVPASMLNSAIQLILPGKPELASIVNSSIIRKLGAYAAIERMYQNKRLCIRSYSTCPNKANSAAELDACAKASNMAPTIQ